MKTAEEWVNEYDHTFSALNEEADKVVGKDVVPFEDIHAILIRRIQLDAMKEGMRRVAAKLLINESPHDMTVCRVHDNILTAAEQLTEKDL